MSRMCDDATIIPTNLNVGNFGVSGLARYPVRTQLVLGRTDGKPRRVWSDPEKHVGLERERALSVRERISNSHSMLNASLASRDLNTRKHVGF